MKHRFIDARNGGAEIWLEQTNSGYFRFQQGIYSQKVLKLVGIFHSPNTERIDLSQQDKTLHFGKPDQIRISDRATARRRR